MFGNPDDGSETHQSAGADRHLHFSVRTVPSSFWLTTKLTDRRDLTCQRFQTQRHRSQAQTAVRCSDLVRRRTLHTKKISGQVPRNSERRPRCRYKLKRTHESRETHENNLRASAVKKSFVQLNLCSSPNVPDQRPHARDICHGTGTQSRGSLYPAGRPCRSHTQKSLATMAEESRQGNRRLKAERTFPCQTFRCRHRLGRHERSVRLPNPPKSPASETESPKTARRKRTQRTQSNGANWSNDRTERRGRPRASVLATDLARPRSLQ